MALDATVKGASSNSYTTRSDANAYFVDRLGVSTVWDGATDANKDGKTTLVDALRLLKLLVGSGISVNGFLGKQHEHFVTLPICEDTSSCKFKMLHFNHRTRRGLHNESNDAFQHSLHLSIRVL